MPAEDRLLEPDILAPNREADFDTASEGFESSWTRAKRDAAAFRHSGLFWGIAAATGAGFIPLVELIVPDSASTLAKVAVIAILSLLGGVIFPAFVGLLLRLAQAPYRQRDEARHALQVEREEYRRLKEPSVRSERLRRLLSGDAAPSNRPEFATLLNRWCALLTGMLRRHCCVRAGEPGHPPKPEDAEAAMREYYADIRQRGIELIDYGIELGFVTHGTRSKLYAPRGPDDLWDIQDEIWAEHVDPWVPGMHR